MVPMLILLTLVAPPDISYRRLLAPAARREFYRTGGHAQLGRRVHIYVDARVFGPTPRRRNLPRGRHALEYANRNVPLLIGPRNPDLVHLLDLLGRRRLRAIRVVSVKGRVTADPDRPGRCVLWVEHLKRTCLSRL